MNCLGGIVLRLRVCVCACVGVCVCVCVCGCVCVCVCLFRDYPLCRYDSHPLRVSVIFPSLVALWVFWRVCVSLGSSGFCLGFHANRLETRRRLKLVLEVAVWQSKKGQKHHIHNTASSLLVMVFRSCLKFIQPSICANCPCKMALLHKVL